MNYREFTERVYNYKHGLTNSAESQTNESIEHSAKGDEWNQHKYKEKIYLGNGTFRYIYDDGTESTGTMPLEYDNPGRQSQRAKPLVDNFNARQDTKEQAQGISNVINTNNRIAQGKSQEAKIIEAGRKSDQGSKALYEESDLAERSIVEAMSQPNADLYSVAERYNTSPAMIYDILSRRNSALITPALEAVKDDANVVKSSKVPASQDFINARETAYGSKPVPYKALERQQEVGKAEEAKAIAAGTRDDKLRTGEDLPWQQIQGTKAETERKLAGNIDKNPVPTSFDKEKTANEANSIGAFLRSNVNGLKANLPDSTSIGTKHQPNFNPAVGQSRSNEAIDIGNFLTQNVQNAHNWDAPQGAPYADLQAQSVQTTRDQQAKNILTEYENAIVYDVLEPLRKAGFEDDYIWKVIDDMEISQTGEGITSYLKDHLDQFSTLTFFPGAEEGLKVYSEKVLPVLKRSVQSTIEEKEEEDFYNSLTPEQKVIFDRTVQKNKQS